MIHPQVHRPSPFYSCGGLLVSKNEWLSRNKVLLIQAHFCEPLNYWRANKNVSFYANPLPLLVNLSENSPTAHLQLIHPPSTSPFSIPPSLLAATCDRANYSCTFTPIGALISDNWLRDSLHFTWSLALSDWQDPRSDYHDSNSPAMTPIAEEHSGTVFVTCVKFRLANTKAAELDLISDYIAMFLKIRYIRYDKMINSE